VNKLINDRNNFFLVRMSPLFTLSIVIFLICTLYKYNWLLFGILCILAVVVILLRPSRFKNVFFIIAVLIELSAYYYGLKHLQAWGYSNPTSFLGFPIWEPICWTIEYIVLGELSVQLYLFLRKRVSSFVYKLLIASLLLLTVYYVYLTFSIVGTIYVLLYAAGLVILLILAHRSFNVLYFFVAAMFGTVIDLIALRIGVWYYTYPYFSGIGMPISLPLAYGISANFLWGLTMLLTNSWKHETGFE